MRTDLEATTAKRVVVFGNSGSGKSTYASHLARTFGLSHLDLDTLVWEPGRVAVPRPADAVEGDLNDFLGKHTRWVVEGCYTEWVELASRSCTELVFLNPGESVCLGHCRARPWEPHKYASAREQDEKLAFLLSWVSAYYTRDESCSLVRHQQLFLGFAGPKREMQTPPDLPLA
jgi:adenylate kinase family enzyme